MEERTPPPTALVLTQAGSGRLQPSATRLLEASLPTGTQQDDCLLPPLQASQGGG